MASRKTPMYSEGLKSYQNLWCGPFGGKFPTSFRPVLAQANSDWWISMVNSKYSVETEVETFNLEVVNILWLGWIPRSWFFPVKIFPKPNIDSDSVKNSGPSVIYNIAFKIYENLVHYNIRYSLYRIVYRSK